MIPINKGIYLYEFQKINIPLPTHSFLISENEKGYCNVCGKYCEKDETVLCQKCGIIVHYNCSEHAYSYCLTKLSYLSGYTLILEEYLAASYTPHQPHLIIESTTHPFICQSCNSEIKGKCYRCLCCDSVFHIDCKPLRDCKLCRTSDPLQHHMLHGADKFCFVCRESIERKAGFHCCWCSVNVHAKCLSLLPSHCSYGKFASVLTKPHIESNLLVVDCVNKSNEFYWSLLHLNPRQLVYSIKDYKSQIIVYCQNLQNFNSKLSLFTNENKIIVTNGDLAQTFGWNIPFKDVIQNITHSVEINCDIWNISHLNKEFCCYCGIGIDAYQLRTKENELIKIMLEKHIHVFLGDKQLNLKGLCGIIFMNIPFYQSTKFVDQLDATLNDRLIEIIGFTSANHFAVCKSGCLMPKHIGTSRIIKVVVFEEIDFEIDGCLLKLSRGVYVIQSFRQLTFLAYKKR
ncbi:phorbol esters/diacylglycerol binding domain (c1 domain) domain containing protein [Entamoeba nuttalli P19]|uniref:Phorbol esters/diacylglycerol binding domain (C1 domain) domain containing protein n=1 Tax=Entamoeba nuttalli (strain P19) TaxID=1076696 RepID=K2HSZ8_ENTNP|nr:phorbol esters/diacylglycerol binding domain (c1 domain) domain containing protein [Entamoeba nuttalli P19]EKE39225.1 phorbol esters/diacylglycerol binding domain (c1 domain) domain containing protein [Entamoeba nuttalli P19]|eukprot:XP_008858440.1 phorbol esters/diacylglycerol binding domain (c1 domain) domain containing protein [Entamoeba nuttalli P19]